MAALGHVWTAPWQELSDVLQHWSGAVTCPACFCGRIWPLALMLCADQVPNKNAHLKACVDPSGLSRSPEQPYLHYVVMPSPIGMADLPANRPHAASASFGSLYLSPLTIIAQAIRAILFASATAATLVGRRSINLASHGRFWVPCLRA